MRRSTTRKLLTGFAGVAVVAGGIAFATNALAQPNNTVAAEGTEQFAATDDLPNPYEAARRDARDDALAGVLTGEYQTEKRGKSTVVKYGNDKGNDKGHGDKGHGKTPAKPKKKPNYVELSREATDRIFVVLVEFGDTPNPYPTAPDATRTEGPLHNQIPQPDRSADNATVWQADYNQSYFQDLYFGGGESLKNYYETQSSGRYSVNGEVTDWVKVNYTQGRYGTDSCGSNVCSSAKFLIRDAANAWYADQLAKGRAKADVDADLASFDVWDRYDWDGDGDFNEPDGFIDHFQIVHAGGDEADGDPIYGQDALWSHRWYSNLAYSDTCSDYLGGCLTGTEVGDSGLWIGDYTMQPENGGRSVFYHEYGHDLGLPDDYSSGSCPLSPAPAGCTDNNNEHWTLMAQSRLGAKDDAGIGERGGDIGAWNKLQLGWLNASVVNYNQHKTINLGPQEYNTKDPQAVVVTLPKKSVSFELGAPADGDKQWYSGHVDNTGLTSISRQVTVPAGGHLTFQTRYDIELGYDFADVRVNGTSVAGTIDGVATPNLGGFYWDGTSVGWVPADFDLSAYAGQTVTLSINYTDDQAVGGNDASAPDGVFVDAVALGGTALSEDGWTATGAWALVGAADTKQFDHFYIAGWRSYLSYDQYLKTGPYFFGYGNAQPDKVDHYAYQQGLLISYWDTSYADNDTTTHPGAGRNLYVDAHPQLMPQASGPYGYWRARVQVYDAPFGKARTDRVTLHVNGQAFTFGSLPGNPTFNDKDTYWFAQQPNHGVKLPGYGVKIQVLNDSGGKMTVKVN